MLTVTEAAKNKLKDTLLANTNDREEGLRLTIKAPGEIGLVLDKQSLSDCVIEYEGLKLLLIEHGVNELLDRATLDVKHSKEGERLTIFQE